MKRSPFKPTGKPLQRKKSLARGTVELKSSKPMARGKAALQRSGKLLRARKPKADKPKRAARNTGQVDYLALCRGPVGCLLLVPGHPHHGHELTEPAHSNQARDGKGMSLKALDIYTVPACRACHRELDQGQRFTRAEKFALWDAAYARWEPVRAALIAQQAKPKHLLSCDTISNDSI